MIGNILAAVILGGLAVVVFLLGVALIQEVLFDGQFPGLPEHCGWFPFRKHDGVEFHVTKGFGETPRSVDVFLTCRRCKKTYEESRLETPDEFEARKVPAKP